MQVNTSRWEKLLAAIEVLRAQSRGFDAPVFEAEGRWQRARREFDRIASRRPAQFGERPAPDVTLAALQLPQPPADPRVPHRPDLAHHDIGYLTAEAQAAEAEAEYSRLLDARSAANRQLSGLETLRRPLRRLGAGRRHRFARQRR